MRRFVDLSHSVVPGLKNCPGLPSPVIGEFLSRPASRGRYADGASFHIGRIDMVANTGTHVDAPFHRYAHGDDLTQLPLESIADLEGVLLRIDPGTREIGDTAFAGADVHDRAVLIETGWARLWGADAYFEDAPYLSVRAARYLVEARARLVGIDSPNIDSSDDPAQPVHSALLKAGIPIVEHLCRLEQLPAAGFRFFAVPVKVQGLGSFPVRAFAIVD